MGLRCSHDAWQGAYSAFNEFRRAVCVSLGGRWDVGTPPAGKMYWTLPPGRSARTDPGLYRLLSRPDDRGTMTPQVCAKVAVELEALLPALDALGDGAGHIAFGGGYGGVARRFIAGCRAAALANERLRFE